MFAEASAWNRLLNTAIGLHAALGVEISEPDYPKVATPDGCVAYLESRMT